LFRNERWALLFLDTLQKHRGSGYLLHEFVLMTDHFHIILTPLISLERAIQYVKGGFSFRAKKELCSKMEVWQRGFSDHRIRDGEDYDIHRAYLRSNPVKRGFCASAEEFPYSSANGRFDLDARPQRLKPLVAGDACGTAKAVPFQSEAIRGTARTVPFQGSHPSTNDLKTNRT
jgi:REP-associated tyrosine transposase